VVFRAPRPERRGGLAASPPRRVGASEQTWPAYLRGWAQRERLHEAKALLDLLDERFRREHFTRGPYFFPDLAETTAEDEGDAITAGQIQATRIDYVGTLRSARRD
jgi:hypothetical protein